MQNDGWLCVLVLVLVSGLTTSPAAGYYNILMILPTASPSVKNGFDPVANELVSRGHKVSILTPLRNTGHQPGVTNVYLEGAAASRQRHVVSFFVGTMTDTSFLTDIYRFLVDLCNSTFRDPFVDSVLRKPRDERGRPRYDLVMTDGIFGELVLPLAHHLRVPMVYLSTSSLFPYQAWTLDIPFPLSYVPVGVSSTSIPMTFGERAANAFQAMTFQYLREHFLLPALEGVVREVLPHTPPLLDLERNVSFVLVNTHPALHGASPKMPYYVEIGGVNCRAAKPLPKDLEDFVASSGGAGLIYFSLGSWTPGVTMPEEMKRKILSAFAQLPQKVLWKYEGQIEALPPNIRLTSWAPQQDLLASSKLRLFITHGGLLSVHEAAFHGCPILGFPLGADQWTNMALAAQAGFAEHLDWRTFSSEDLLKKIRLMIADSRYKERALEMAKLYRDNPLRPAETAAYWLEYVIRHQGAPHLKSGARHLNFFQYFLLDVLGAAVLVLFVVVFLTFLVIRCVRNAFVGGSKKVKKN